MLSSVAGPSFRWAAIGQAFLVTLLWSSSWVLIKWGLSDLPALTFAGLRYALAAACLWPWLLSQPHQVAALRRLSLRSWLSLAGLGVVYYTITQGAQFIALAYLPAVTTSLLLSLSPLLVVLFGRIWLHETLTQRQWLGVSLNIAGVLRYFWPVSLTSLSWVGIAIAVVSMTGNAAATTWGRAINRSAAIPPALVTGMSMSLGAALLLGVGLSWQGVPPLAWRHWALIAWLALVNTALAFTLWNMALRTLSAVEASLINNTMLIQIALLAWLVLHESISGRQAIGLALAALGALLTPRGRVAANTVESAA